MNSTRSGLSRTAERRARQPGARRVHRLQHAAGALFLVCDRRFLRRRRGRHVCAQLRDRDRRGRRHGPLGRLSAVHVSGRCDIFLRPDHRRRPHGRRLRAVLRGDEGLAALPRPDLPVHGDVCARRHRQSDHDEPARRRAPQAAPPLGLVCAACGDSASHAGRRRRADRDGVWTPIRIGWRHGRALPRPNARHGKSVVLDRRARPHGRRLGGLRSRAPPLRAKLGPDPERNRSHDDVQGADMSGAVPAIELKGLCKSFGKTEIIRGCDLAVAPGERIGIIGPNGAGKSTLFNLISGRFGPTSGEILLNGKRIDGMLPYEINRLGLARSFQITNIFGRLSVFENLRCGLLWSMGYRYAFWKFLADLRDANERAAQLLSMIRLEKKRDTLAMDLTYAEQRALEIGVTIAGGAEVVLLDEPTAGMSTRETARFIELIREVTVGKTLLTVEHDMGVVFGLADKIAVLVYGEVIAFDVPEAVRANPRV